jgi:hypothetical protein
MLRIIIENRKVTFKEAIEEQFKVIQLFVKYEVLTHVRIKKNEYLLGEEINKEFLKVLLAKKIQKDLSNLNDLNTSRIGYNLWLPTLSFGKAGSLSITFGKPSILGEDIIIFEPHSSVLPKQYSEIATKYYKILLELIPVVKPISVIFQTRELKIKMKDEDYDYGFIMYKKGDGLKKLMNGKQLKLDKLCEGYIWKSSFNSYEKGILSVLESWKSTK